MMSYNYLPGPELPQMLNDDYITHVELDADGGVIVEVGLYNTAQPGDYLRIYWDGQLVNTLAMPDPSVYHWPWITRVPSDYAPDGPHQVYYTVSDVAQNLSASAISSAFVDRDHTGGLPAPDFPDAEENTITYASVVQNNGTHVHIPNTGSVLFAGDTVYLYWGEYDAQGVSVPDSNTSVTHIVTDDDTTSSGFTLLVPSPYVTWVDSGTARAWYSVVPPGDAAQSSATGSVTIDMTLQTAYPAPVLPAGNDGWIECAEITADGGTQITVPASPLFSAGGTVSVYWQGYDAGGEVPGTYWEWLHTLSVTDIGTGFSALVPAAYLTPVGIGYARAWYQVSGVAQPGTSAVAQVNIDSQHCSPLPAPVFPDAAGDNTITSSEVTASDGTDMVIAWPDMEAGDIMNAFWTVFQTTLPPPVPVPGSNWTQTRTLTTNEQQAQQVVFHIPAENITSATNGYGEGRYQVMYQSGGIASSDATDVNISINVAPDIRMHVVDGAAANSTCQNKIALYCANPLPVTITVNGQATLMGDAESQEVNVILNIYGPTIISVSDSVVESVNISVIPEDVDIAPLATELHFVDIEGAGSQWQYSYNTCAPADGLTPVDISFYDSDPYDEVRTFTLSGSAVFRDTNVKIKKWNSYEGRQFSASAQITNTVAEKITVNIAGKEVEVEFTSMP